MLNSLSTASILFPVTASTGQPGRADTADLSKPKEQADPSLAKNGGQSTTRVTIGGVELPSGYSLDDAQALTKKKRARYDAFEKGLSSNETTRLEARLTDMRKALNFLSQKTDPSSGGTLNASLLIQSDGDIRIETWSSPHEFIKVYGSANSNLNVDATGTDLSTVVVSKEDGDNSVSAQGQALSAYTGGGNDAVSFMAAQLDGVYTKGGNDAVALVAGELQLVDTGSGDDALSVLAEQAMGIQTGSGNDALALRANVARSVDSGSGTDAVTIVADKAADIDTGTGDDALDIRAKEISQVTTGAGNDVVRLQQDDMTTDAASRIAEERAALEFAFGGAHRADKIETVGFEAYLGYKAAIAATRADVDLGEGDDLLQLSGVKDITVDAGTGNDTIQLGSGSALVRFGVGSGNDAIILGADSRVMIEVATDAPKPEITKTDGALVLTFGTDSITITGDLESSAVGFYRQGEPGTALLHGS